jgi:hypothetical protein
MGACDSGERTRIDPVMISRIAGLRQVDASEKEPQSRKGLSLIPLPPLLGPELTMRRLAWQRARWLWRMPARLFGFFAPEDPKQVRTRLVHPA